jgi:hypothetical protein
MGNLLYILSPLIPIIGGILALSNWIVQKIPSAQGVVKWIKPYTGWIGVVMFIWGVKEIYFSIGEGFNIFWFLTGLSDLLLGFILGFGLISKYSSGVTTTGTTTTTAEVKKPGMMALAQMPLGIFAIIMGIIYIIKFGIH